MQETRTGSTFNVAAIASYRDLEVWQVAMSTAQACVIKTKRFPSEEQFGLATQMRRAAVSIPSNIAEGHGRRTGGSYLHHLCIAAGSQAELESQVELAARLGYLSELDAKLMGEQLATLGRLLTALIRAMRRKQEQRRRMAK